VNVPRKGLRGFSCIKPFKALKGLISPSKAL
jgi:hypothetical protein